VPTITGLSPSSATMGAAAQTLTINGTNFMSSSTVTYNSVAHNATFVSATQLTIPLSASDQATAGTDAVIVTNPSPGGGASNSMNFTIDNPLPTITSLSPSSATTGAAAQTLTINGMNFLANSTVTYNSTARTATFVSSTQLTISLSASDQATGGSFAVIVTNPSPGGGPSNSMSFSVKNPVPSITSLSPSSLTAGSEPQGLTINGIGFVSNSTVMFNSVAHSATFVSSDQLTISLTASDLATAGSFPVIVTNPAPGGGASNVADFSVASGSTATVSVFPSTIQLPPSGLQQFTAAVTGTSNTAVTWAVNGLTGGNSSVGTISTGGLYTAPSAVPNPATVTVAATSQAVPSTNGSANVTIGPYNVEILYSFNGTGDGASPESALFEGSDGYYYGTNPFSGYASGDGTVFKIDSSGTLTTLYSFTGSGGASPYGALVQGSDGNFYGTTSAGGNSSGSGTVFRMDSTGILKILYSFSGPDGANPLAGLVQASDGYFYGTTSAGGASNDGTVFKISATGNLETLYSFSGSDGANPHAALIQATDGYFYGTTPAGGTSNNGTVFKVNSTGNLQTLYSFTGGSDGASPSASMLQATDGYFYGTTASGGDTSCTALFQSGSGGPDINGCGTTFKIDSAGNFTLLHQFSGAEGGEPMGALTQGKDGDFYGTSYIGGNLSCEVEVGGVATNGCGTVFQMDSAGHVNALYLFGDSAGDGLNPLASLVLGSDGHFYGTTEFGGTGTQCPGSYDCGTIFRLSGLAQP
jgi:uncharacterized repeat protein (TIGR03803 family)